MKTLRKRTCVITLALCLGLTASTSAFLGIGDIVFDPAVYAQAIEQVIRLERQITQLAQSYQMLTRQYDQMLWAARRVPVNMVARYRALVTPWRKATAGNRSGVTARWTAAANSGLDVMAGYAMATEPLQDYGGAFGQIPFGQRERVRTSYATIELADGAAQGTLELLGRLRANAPALQDAILRLEDDSLSAAPEMNTQVAVLNKINAASLIALRSTQDTNQLLVLLAEHQVVSTKRTRDAEARSINQHIRFLSQGRAALASQAAGASTAMLKWRMP